VIRRFIHWFIDFGIPVGGVVVNSVIQTEGFGPEIPEFVRNRVSMQQGYLGEIHQRFTGMVRAIVPLYESEVRGVPMLERVGKTLFA